MSTTRIEQVKNNFFWGVITNLISIVFQFVLRTAFLLFLSNAYLGLNSLCVSILSVINLSNLGLTSAFIFRLYKPVAEKNVNEVNSLLSIYRKVYIFLGLFVAIIGICILFFLKHLIKSDIPQDVNIYLIFSLYLLQNMLSFIVFGYKELILWAEQRTDINNMITSFWFGLMYIFQVIFVIHMKYTLFVAAMPVCAVLMGISRAKIVDKIYPQYKVKYKIDKAYIGEVFKEAISISIYKIRDLSRNSLDSVVISSFLGLALLADYQNYYMILSVPILLRTIICGAITPGLGNYVATKNRNDTYKIFLKMTYCIIYISGWFSICFFCLIQDFIVLWIGRKFLLSTTTVFLLTFMYYILGYSIVNLTVRETTGIYKYGKKMALIEMLVNLLLNVLLVNIWGINGIISATIITIILFSIPYELYVIHVIYFKKEPFQLLGLCGKAFIETCIVAVIIYYICNLIRTITIGTFILKGLISIILPTFIFTIFHFRDKEMQEVFFSILKR